MYMPNPARLIITYSLLALIVASAVTAIATTNTVPSTRLTNQSENIGINDLKPYACGGAYLTNVVSGSGTLTGTEGNDLILGSSGVDTINGLGGDDCILGGGEADICTGGNGSDVFITCEVEAQ